MLAEFGTRRYQSLHMEHTTPSQQAKILVIEDRREVLDVLQRTLSDNGFTVVTAVDGDEGLQAALDQQPHLIILDIGPLVRADWRSRVAPIVARDRMDAQPVALVVDDSITVRRVTQRLLERNGMKVLTARDGMDAIAVLAENLPDVILLDIEMPRMDGYEVAAQVRNDPRTAAIPIIMITSRVGDKHRARAIELGVDDYLGKPYQEAQLLEAIEPLVARRRAQAGAGGHG